MNQGFSLSQADIVALQSAGIVGLANSRDVGGVPFASATYQMWTMKEWFELGLLRGAASFLKRLFGPSTRCDESRPWPWLNRRSGALGCARCIGRERLPWLGGRT